MKEVMIILQLIMINKNLTDKVIKTKYQEEINQYKLLSEIEDTSKILVQMKNKNSRSCMVLYRIITEESNQFQEEEDKNPTLTTMKITVKAQNEQTSRFSHTHS